MLKPSQKIPICAVSCQILISVTFLIHLFYSVIIDNPTDVVAWEGALQNFQSTAGMFLYFVTCYSWIHAWRPIAHSDSTHKFHLYVFTYLSEPLTLTVRLQMFVRKKKTFLFILSKYYKNMMLLPALFTVWAQSCTIEKLRETYYERPLFFYLLLFEHVNIGCGKSPTVVRNYLHVFIFHEIHVLISPRHVIWAKHSIASSNRSLHYSSYR